MLLFASGSKCCPAFAQSRIHNLGLDIAYGLLTALGRHTISRGICARASQHKEWSRFYRFFSKDIWSPVIMTHQQIKQVRKHLHHSQSVCQVCSLGVYCKAIAHNLHYSVHSAHTPSIHHPFLTDPRASLQIVQPMVELSPRNLHPQQAL